MVGVTSPLYGPVYLIHQAEDELLAYDHVGNLVVVFRGVHHMPQPILSDLFIENTSHERCTWILMELVDIY